MITADVSNSVFPPDLTVGRVTSVDTQDAGLGLTVKIRPAVDYNDARVRRGAALGARSGRGPRTDDHHDDHDAGRDHDDHVDDDDGAVMRFRRYATLLDRDRAAPGRAVSRTSASTDASPISA